MIQRGRKKMDRGQKKQIWHELERNANEIQSRLHRKVPRTNGFRPKETRGSIRSWRRSRPLDRQWTAAAPRQLHLSGLPRGGTQRGFYPPPPPPKLKTDLCHLFTTLQLQRLFAHSEMDSSAEGQRPRGGGRSARGGADGNTLPLPLERQTRCFFFAISDQKD